MLTVQHSHKDLAHRVADLGTYVPGFQARSLRAFLHQYANKPRSDGLSAQPYLYVTTVLRPNLAVGKCMPPIGWRLGYIVDAGEISKLNVICCCERLCP